MNQKISNKFLQFAILVAVSLLGFILTSFITFAILSLAGLDVYVIETMGIGFWENLNLIKVIQVLSSILIFILPALSFAYLVYDEAINFLKLKPKLSNKKWVLGSLLIFAIIVIAFPFLAYILQWNMGLNLPENLEWLENWMRDSESAAAELTVAFLKMDTFWAFLFNLFVVAIMPAISEELLFRGVIQQWFSSFLNIHIAILITSILFSAMHMQFFGFFPRMIIGMYLGYIFYWSENLWFPIIGHFFNNGLQVIAVYLGAVNSETAANAPDTQVPIWGAALSLILLTFLCWVFKKQFSTKTDYIEV